MYLRYFGLAKAPFHVTPDPDFLFPSPSHREAYASLVYGIGQRKGFIVLTGEVGAGKTTILRAYLQSAKGEGVQPIYLFNPQLEYEDLLHLLIRETGGDPEGKNSAEMTAWIHEHLVCEYQAGKNVTLIIDEAQNMPVETLERLRMLSNIETSEEKLLQIVLAGQPELDEKLGLHTLRQLRQRIAVRAEVLPLKTRECLAYIHHRIGQAGGNYTEIFTSAALRRIVRHAKGNPRTVNIVCDNALLAGYGAGMRPVSAALVRDVIAGLAPKRRRSWRPILAAAAAAVLVLAALWTWTRPGDLGSGALATAEAAHSTEVTPQDHAAQQAGEEILLPESSAAPPEASPEPVAPPPSAMIEPSQEEAPLTEDLLSKAPPHEAPPLETPLEAAISTETASGEAPVPEEPPQEAVSVAMAYTPEPAETPEPTAETLSPEPANAVLPDVSAEPAMPREELERVVVSSGESLSKIIARRYGRCTSALLKEARALNPDLDNPDYIVAGDVLFLPPVPRDAAANTHTPEDRRQDEGQP